MAMTRGGMPPMFGNTQFRGTGTPKVKVAVPKMTMPARTPKVAAPRAPRVPSVRMPKGSKRGGGY